jgi:protocatechuate 3,4-dioxygenase beta subunit
MQRRDFIKSSTLCAVAVYAHGYIRFDGNHFIGDCETTTDILGPFYRPDSPVRTKLALYNEAGELVELSGIIRHHDCVTPYKNARVELWHCNSKGEYDNSSPEFRYRGTTFSDEKGHYSFLTNLPVPYADSPKHKRPAHFHLMITTERYQPLVTQLYFTGDPYIKDDIYASSPSSERRILTVQKTSDGTKKVAFDISMSETLRVETPTLDKLAGTYKNNENNEETVFFKHDDTLWMKNQTYGYRFIYTGNNSFESVGAPSKKPWKLHFEILSSGDIQLTEIWTDMDLVQHTFISLKKKL